MAAFVNETHWRLHGTKLALQRDLGETTEEAPVAKETASANVHAAVSN